MRFFGACATLLGVALPACGNLAGAGPTLPTGVVCDAIHLAAGSAERLTAALAAAEPGHCVVVDGATYRGNFEVPADVSLLANEGAAVDLVGESPDAPALRIRGGPRASVRSLRVVSAAGVGIVIDPGPAVLINVTVHQAQRSGLIATCSAPDCAERGPSLLTDVELTGNANGLWVVGSKVRMEGGRVSENNSTQLSSGHGVIASGGASVELIGTEVERNQEVGVLVDGAGGTSADLDGVQVRENGGRGIWGQGLTGAEQPKLRVRNATLDGNRLVGIGLRQSTGVEILDSQILNTVQVEVPVNLGGMQSVGDGVGLFEQTGAARLENLTFQGNARSQVLIDSAKEGISVNAPKFPGAVGEYKIVIQRTTAQVQAPADDIETPPTTLGISADPVSVQNP